MVPPIWQVVPLARTERIENLRKMSMHCDPGKTSSLRAALGSAALPALCRDAPSIFKANG
jgi:hypothetical protein